MSLPLLLGQLLALLGGGGALYLEVRELEEKCFIQEIPDGTVVIGARAASPGLTRLSPRVPRGGGVGRRGIAQARTFPPRTGWAWVGNRWAAVCLKQPRPCPFWVWGLLGGKSDPGRDEERKAWLERGGERRRSVVRPLTQTPGSSSTYPNPPGCGRSWVGLW